MTIPPDWRCDVCRTVNIESGECKTCGCLYPDLVERYNERAAILEHEAKMKRADAEKRARQMVLNACAILKNNQQQAGP